MGFNRLANKFAQSANPLAGTGQPMAQGGANFAAGAQPQSWDDPMMQQAPGAPDMGMGAMDPSQMGDTPQQFTLGSLTDFIQQDADGAMEFLKTKVPNAQVEFVDGDGQKRVTELWGLLEPENWRHSDDETKGKVAGLIQENLPPELKAEENMGTEDSNVMPAVKQVADIKASVEASNAAIYSFAKSVAKGGVTKRAFNSLDHKTVKTAEGLPVEVYPLLNESTSIDIRTMQPINNRDIIERNKSWGLRPYSVFSRMGIDYENFWQTHVMDKFYSEYRDKDGNWVGGYIQKRFEVDKNIPEFNNMQYKPGERHKPARATLLEGKLEEHRGGKSFNLLTAKSARVVKTAQGEPWEQEKFDFNSGEQKVQNASDAEIQYALDDLKKVIEIQEKDRRVGGHTPKLGYYWDEYHTYAGEKQRRVQEGRWNPSPNAQATNSQLPGVAPNKPAVDPGLPALTAGGRRSRACKTCGTAMFKTNEGDNCPACVKSQSDESVREAALQKKK